MSIKLKLEKHRNGRSSRVFKKTRRGFLKKVESSHLPMKVHSYSSYAEPFNDRVYLSYSKIYKFLKARIGKPVDKIYSEFLVEARKYKQVEDLKELFQSFINQTEQAACRGYERGGLFYVSNGILNLSKFKVRKSPFTKNHIKYNREHFLSNLEMSDLVLKLGHSGPQLLNKMWIEVNGNVLCIPVYLVSKVRWELLQEATNKIIGIYGKSDVERIKEFTRVNLGGYGFEYASLTWEYKTLKSYDRFYYVAKISDIETYKKEKYKI